MDGMVLGLFLLAAFLGGLTTGLAGFAMGLVVSGVWLHILTPFETAILVTFFGVVTQAYAVWWLRRVFSWRKVAPFVIGSAIGVPLGTLLLAYADPAHVRTGVGVLLVIYSGYNLVRPALHVKRSNPAIDVGIGIANGWLGGLTELGGIIIAVWCQLRGWPKDEQRAVFQPVLLMAQIMGAVSLSLRRRRDARDNQAVPARPAYHAGRHVVRIQAVRKARRRRFPQDHSGPAPDRGPVADRAAGHGKPVMSNASLLFAARSLRDFGDGFVAVLLPAYLLALGFSPLQVGVIATASLLGSALLTIGVGLLGVRYDHRQLLLAAAGLMIATGVAFAVVHDYALLLLVAFAGTINPSSGSVSVFVPLEHAALTGAVDRQRSGPAHFARYSLVGALAGAFGALAAATPDLMTPLGLDQLTGIKVMFVALCAARRGRRPVLCTASARARSSGTAARPRRSVRRGISSTSSRRCSASMPSPAASSCSRCWRLWLFERFDMSLAAASLFFFWSGVLSAFSFPVAAWLSQRIGLINTMVFTHIPSSIALMLAAIAPTLPLALALLLIRSALSQMDVPTRSSYVMAVVTENERAAAASFTAVPRSLAAAASPALAGAMFAASPAGLAAAHLRRLEDRLRPAAVDAVPAPQAAGGAVAVR